MDQDLRNAALAAFKKSESKDEPQPGIDDDVTEEEDEEATEVAEDEEAADDEVSVETDEDEVAVAELAPTPAANKARTGVPRAKSGRTSVQNARPRPPSAKARAGGKPEGRPKTASSKGDTTFQKRTRESGASVARERHGEPRVGTKSSTPAPASRPAGKGLIVLSVLLNLILLVLVIVLFNITSGIDTKLDRQYRELTEIQQKAMTNMADALQVIHKFSRFKMGVYVDSKKGPQSVILVLDEKGKVLKTVVMPVALEK